jgi:hypothetical protein
MALTPNKNAAHRQQQRGASVSMQHIGSNTHWQACTLRQLIAIASS